MSDSGSEGFPPTPPFPALGNGDSPYTPPLAQPRASTAPTPVLRPSARVKERVRTPSARALHQCLACLLLQLAACQTLGSCRGYGQVKTVDLTCGEASAAHPGPTQHQAVCLALYITRCLPAIRPGACMVYIRHLLMMPEVANQYRKWDYMAGGRDQGRDQGAASGHPSMHCRRTSAPGRHRPGVRRPGRAGQVK